MDAWLSSQHRLWNWGTFNTTRKPAVIGLVPPETQLQLAIRVLDAQSLSKRLENQK